MNFKLKQCLPYGSGANELMGRVQTNSEDDSL